MVDDVLARTPVESRPADPDAGEPAAVADPGPGTGRPVRPPALLPWWAAIPTAIAAGLVLFVAFPPINQWYLAPVGVALLALATFRRRFRAGFGLGLLAGLALLVPLLELGRGLRGGRCG